MAFSWCDAKWRFHGVTIDVQKGASGLSADAPGVGHEMVSGLKLPQKDETK